MPNINPHAPANPSINWLMRVSAALDNKEDKDIGTGEDLQDIFTAMGSKVVTNEQHREVTMHPPLPPNKVLGNLHHRTRKTGTSCDDLTVVIT